MSTSDQLPIEDAERALEDIDHIQAGLRCYDQKLLLDAVYHFENALRCDPRAWRAHHMLAKSYIWLSMYEMALLHLRIAEDLAPDEPGIWRSAFYLFLKLGMDTQARRLLPLLATAEAVAPDIVERLSTDGPVNSVNLGGGPSFRFPGWLNFDTAIPEEEPGHLRFTPDTILPVADASLQLAYSSHNLEHLDDATVSRLLTETRRVLDPGGAFIIKIPDFEQCLDAWRRRDASAFADAPWNFPAVTPSWPNRQVTDSIHARCAYVFCGFWNSAFGDLFGDCDPTRPGAYNGPPALGVEQLAVLLDSIPSPKAVADALRRIVLETETDYRFNHQNAWSRAEMAALLETHGFRLLSTEKELIVERYKNIPHISSMYDISAYYIAAPR